MHLNQQHNIRWQLRHPPREIADARKTLEHLQANIAIHDRHEGAEVVMGVGGQVLSGKGARKRPARWPPPPAGENRITAPVLVSADLAKIARQIQAIQATQDGKAKRPAKAASAKPPLVPVQPKQATRASKEVTSAAQGKLGVTSCSIALDN